MSPPTSAYIDKLLVSIATSNWQKVAMVIAKTARTLRDERTEIDENTLAERINVLCEEGNLQSQGNLSNWRGSEVRLPRMNGGH